SFAMSNQVVVRYDPLEGYSHEFLSDGTNEIIMPTTGTSTQEACLFLYVDKADWTTYQSDFRVDQLDQSDAQISSTSLATVALYNMVRGRAYRICFLSNTVVSDLAEEEKWEMYKDDPVRKFETEEEISTYFAGLTTGKLEEDLDFNDILLSNEVITLSANFTRGVNLSKSFDGNYHTIKNIHVKNGLFNSIPSGCTVQNLKLENVRVFADENSTHAGILAPISQGTISNVRIVGANMIGTNGSGYVGGLVGMNKGNISNVMISGVLTIDSYNDISNAGSLFCIGGLVGANGDAKSGNYSITNCTVDAGALIKVAGEIPDTEAYIGGLVGYNAIAKTVSGSSTSVSIDAIDLHSKNCYVGGFVGYNRGIVRLGNATGNITGGSVSSSLSGSGLLSATGGFVGYATSGTETASANFAVMNGCSASGIVRESDNGILPSYTGGLAGFAEIDILNGSSTGTLEIASGVNPEKRMGALIGILAAASTIHNSYSMSIRSDGITMLITGAVSCQTDNCHYLGKMLRADNGCEHDTPIPARAITLNNGRKTGYWEWVESSAIHGGAPYLVKQ
ncbi:hypothetical protein LJB85_03820, partial [Porphyromonadaceae bacterium OttesenSCG-928-L07]|nr:hypothetical protein [Porphyromonadaceae bacterium OttesenSCG-928-L07]